jgi:NAD(P)-dependent dehydrogenase (short-subunit alcohol dehydrogenase family)
MAKEIPVILVTGASRGLGRGIAVRLADLGMSVVVNFAGNAAAAEETVAMCEKRRLDRKQQFFPMRADIGARGDRYRMVEETLKHLGRIDALVNNAGVAPRSRVDLTETTEESFEEVLRINLAGPFFLTQSVVQYWLKQRPKPILPDGFKVVFNTSISATTASITRAEYSISKAGLAMVNQLWAVRLAEEGVQVYELRPGIMATDMTSGVKEKYDKLLAEGLVPQKRWGSPEDVGKAVGALLTGAFPYSTGSAIYVDGGFHISRL